MTQSNAVQKVSEAEARADKVDSSTMTRFDLVERLGERAGEALFQRIDHAFREGEQVIVANVREARKSFSAALAPGHARVVKAQRAAKAGRPGAEEEMVLIGLSDFEAVVKANESPFSWADAFAPRRDLPAAAQPLSLRPGARGRKLAL